MPFKKNINFKDTLNLQLLLVSEPPFNINFKTVTFFRSRTYCSWVMCFLTGFPTMCYGGGGGIPFFFKWTFLKNFCLIWFIFESATPCTPLYNRVQPCIQPFVIIYYIKPHFLSQWTLCSTLYNHVHPCTTLYINVQPCTTMYNRVHPCTTTYKHV